MSSEIIQSVAYDNYDDFQDFNFIFSWNFISLFWELFNDEIDLRVRYLSMKEGRLFCFVVMRSTALGCFKSFSWCLWKALDKGLGCMGLVPWRLDLQCKSSWILNDFFTKN